MPEDVANGPPPAPERERVTSISLPLSTVITSWSVGALALSAGTAATFLTENQAGSAGLIVLGSGAIFLGIVRRMPLRLEVAGAKIDATFLADRAFEDGRASGIVEGLGIAEAQAIETSSEDGAIDPSETRIIEDLRTLAVSREHAVTEGHRAVEDGPGTSSSETGPRLVVPEHVGWSGPNACRAAGVTYRQLDYWARTGLVEPSIRPASGGNARYYSMRDIVILRVVKNLLDTGIGLGQIRTAVARIRSRDEKDLLRVTLMSDGHQVFETTTVDEVISLVESGQGVFGISVGRVWRDIAGRLDPSGNWNR